MANPDALVVVVKSVVVGGAASKDYYFGTHPIRLTGAVAVPRIANDPEYSQAIGVAPWQRRASSSYGAIELINNDGGLDDWLNADVRDKVVELWVGESTDAFTSFTKVATAMIDNAEPNGELFLSLNIVPNIAKLDETLQEVFYTSSVDNSTLEGQPVPVTFGRCFSVPAVVTNATTHTYDVHDGSYADLVESADNGDAFESGDLTETTRGFDLVNKPNGLITAEVLGEPDRSVFTLGSDVLLGIGAFTTWVSDNPSGWTTSETGNNIVTESSDRCEFFCTDSATFCSVTSGNRLTVGNEYRLTIPTIANGTFGGRANVKIECTDGTEVQELRADATLTGSSLTINFTAEYQKIRISSRSTSGFQSVIIDNLTVKQKLFSTAFTKIGQVCKHIVNTRFGLDVDSSTFDAVDTALGTHEVGRHIGRVATGNAVLQPLLDSYWCYLYETTGGDIAMRQLVAPAASSVLTINQSQIERFVDPEPDFAPGLSTKLGAQRNWVQINESSAAGSLDTDDKFKLSTDFRATKKATSSVHSFYTHATNACVVGTDIADTSSAETEAERRAVLYGSRRWFYSLTAIATSDTLQTLMPGDTVTLKADRYGLSSGKALIVVSKSARFLGRTVDLTLWG